MDDGELMRQVRELRARGCTPKAIARVLGVRPARVAALVRAIAAEAAHAAPEPGLVGCWVSRGWSEGLAVAGHREWRESEPRQRSTGGLAGVVVAREHGRDDKVSACGYLVDTWCLGVKNVLGPRSIRKDDLPVFVRHFFDGFDGWSLPAPFELARELVLGAVAYARSLGFEPHRDFPAAAGHLGPPMQTHSIRFGRRGKPCYIQGPHDDARRIMRTLEVSVGQGNFHFTVSADAFDLAALA